MSTLEIIGLPQSNFVWATRIACVEKGVAHRSIPAPPHSPDVCAIHPLGKIPVMRHGQVSLFESRAICAYVDRAFDGPSLTPGDTAQAAMTEQWLSMIVTTIEPVLIRRYLFGYMFPGTTDGSPNRAQIDAALPELSRYLGVLDRAIAAGRLGASPFTLADAFLIPILFYLKALPEAVSCLAELPALAAYLTRQTARDSVVSTMPPPPGSA